MYMLHAVKGPQWHPWSITITFNRGCKWWDWQDTEAIQWQCMECNVKLLTRLGTSMDGHLQLSMALLYNTSVLYSLNIVYCSQKVKIRIFFCCIIGWLPVSLENLKPSSKHISWEMLQCRLLETFRNVVLGLRPSVNKQFQILIRKRGTTTPPPLSDLK